MKNNNHHSSNARRLHEMEERFRELESRIEDPDVKQALSLLHGMIHENRRNDQLSRSGDQPVEAALQEIANLYRHAPKMEGPALNQALPTGTRAPAFSLPDAHGKPVSLDDFRGKRILLVFYPLDWSSGCSQQLSLYQGELAEFEKRNIQVVGISVDSIYSHGSWAAVRGIHFPLLADFHPKGEVAKKYHVYRETEGFSERALYVIDEQGIIQYGFVSPFLHHVPNIYELYNKLDALKAATALADS